MIRWEWYNHFTTPERAAAIHALGRFHFDNQPVHSVAKGLSEKTIANKRTFGKRLCLSLDDSWWDHNEIVDKTIAPELLRETGRKTKRTGKTDSIFFDYDLQKWMVRRKAIKVVKLAAVRYQLKPDAKVLLIDNPDLMEKVVDIGETHTDEYTGEHYSVWSGFEDWFKRLLKPADVVFFVTSKATRKDSEPFKEVGGSTAVVLNMDSVILMPPGD